jgi:hypothetical protein
MKKFTLALSALFVAAILNAQAPVSSVSATPSTIVTPQEEIAKVLEIRESSHDFGKIAMGKAVEFDVLIKNVSTEPVKIENVKVGCGCTTPKYEVGKVHAPGESFKVTLGFSNQQEGHFEKVADIFFSNGLSKQIKFFGDAYRVAENSAPANAPVQKLKAAGK